MNSPPLTLYHGSRRGISGAIRPDLSDGACDFGCGFYMGTDVHQPQTLICEETDPVFYTLSLDSPYSRFQWMGEEYALSTVAADAALRPGCRPDDVDPDALFWMGYTYRYWHYLTGETSREMYALADYNRMRRVYPGYHTVSCELAVKWLKEDR